MSTETEKIVNIKQIDITHRGCIGNVSEALSLGQLNFVVECSEVIGVNGVDIPNHKVLSRECDNTLIFLGLVGQSYQAINNTEFMAFADDIINDNYCFSKTVSKDNGAVSLLFMTSNDEIFVDENNSIKKQIRIQNGFDGVHSLKVDFEAIHVQTGITLTSSGKHSSVSFRHTLKLSDKMGVSNKITKEADIFFGELVTTYKQLCEHITTASDVETFVNSLYSSASQNETKKLVIVDLYEETGGTSLWHLYIAGCTFYNTLGSTNAGKRLDSFMFGTGGKKNKMCLDVIRGIK